MRIKNRTSTLRHFLPALLCAAALAVGGALGLWNARVEHAPFDPVPSLEAAPSPDLASPPLPAEPPPELGADRGRAAPTAGSMPQTRRPAQGGAQTRPAPKAPPADLSAYRPQPRGAQEESYLPQDKSLSAKRLKGHLAEKNVSDDEGKGLLNDIIRGGRRVLKSVDDATLSASRRAFGDIARPEEAKIRPYGDGARLHIGIPAHTVNLGRKQK